MTCLIHVWFSLTESNLTPLRVNVKYPLLDRQTSRSALTDDDTLISYTADDEKALFINIAPYMNDSVLTVREEYVRTCDDVTVAHIGT